MSLDEYGAYQLRWMFEHGHGIDELIDGLDQIDLDGIGGVRGAYEAWERDVGFGGELWACRAEHAEEVEKQGPERGGVTDDPFDTMPDLLKEGFLSALAAEESGEPGYVFVPGNAPLSDSLAPSGTDPVLADRTISSPER